MNSIVTYKIGMFETLLCNFLILQKRFELIWSYIWKVIKFSFNFRLYPQNELFWGRLCNFQEYIVLKIVLISILKIILFF